jgi:dTDP-4-dehydrorhamnose reductase
MAILLFGATGMLGQAISAEAVRRKEPLIGAARRGAQAKVDLAASGSVEAVLKKLRPTLVINAAAVTNLDQCEREPGRAYEVNARAVAVMSEYCRAAGTRFVQISTDHFFTGDRDRAHAEGEPLCLVNEYARSKYVAECFAGLCPGALILRTNVAGLRGWPGQPTFAEWALAALVARAPLRLFEDFYTSTIDAPSLAQALFDLVELGAQGLIHVAARNVASKRAFVHALARQLDITLDWDEVASVKDLPTPRAESLGLDVSKAERLLGRALPDVSEVCRRLATQWEEQRCAMPAA